MSKTYEAPALDTLEVSVEEGFAATTVNAGGEGGHWVTSARPDYAYVESEDF